MLRYFEWGIQRRLLVGSRGSIKGQYQPRNCHSITQAIKLHSAIFGVEDDWILTYIAKISCSPENEWSHERLLSPFVGKERVQRSWVCSEPRGTPPPALENGVSFLSAALLCVAKSSLSSPSWQLAFVWKWNKLLVLKVSCRVVAPNPAVQPTPQ